MDEPKVLNRTLWLEDFSLPVGVPFTVRLTQGEVSISCAGYSISLTLENGVLRSQCTGDSDVICSNVLFNIADLRNGEDENSISI